MRLLLVSDARSIHTKRWARAISDRGVEVILYTLHKPSDDYFASLGIEVVFFDLFKYQKEKGRPADKFISHFKCSSHLRKTIRNYKIDILHAHYASSYGLVAALTHFRPFVLSVWGSDIYRFPNLSKANLYSIKYTLRSADYLLSTSHSMADYMKRFTSKEAIITPFGVDTKLFSPSVNIIDNNYFSIGFVKSLAPVYGADDVIDAFLLFQSENPQVDARLTITGKGPDEQRLKEKVSSLGLSDKIRFTGYIPNSELPKLFRSFDVALFMSRQESFGVAAVEAMSCGVPVVATETDGFCEVIRDGLTGIIVPVGDTRAAADALKRLYSDPSLRKRFAGEGRRVVEMEYDWDENVNIVMNLYKKIEDGRRTER